MSLGSLIGTLVTYGANQAYGANVYDNRSWKVPLYVGVAAPTIALVGMLLFMPESPYWYVLKNRTSDARRSLQKLHPNKSAEEVDRLYHELQYTVLKERDEQATSRDASYLECLSGPNLQRTFAALFPSLAQQLVGNQLVQSYSTCKQITCCDSSKNGQYGTRETAVNRGAQTSLELPASPTPSLAVSSCLLSASFRQWWPSFSLRRRVWDDGTWSSGVSRVSRCLCVRILALRSSRIITC